MLEKLYFTKKRSSSQYEFTDLCKIFYVNLHYKDLGTFSSYIFALPVNICFFFSVVLLYLLLLLLIIYIIICS